MEGLTPVSAAKAIIVIVFASTLFRCVCGVNITVGGASGWDLVSNIQSWSSSITFNVGDDLVFIYTPVNDVVEVNKQGYDTCTITNAIATYDTGETVIKLTEQGTRYFVCGRMGHCQQGLKLEAQVLDQSNNNGTNEDQNQPGRGGRIPPRRPPPRRPPPSHPPGPPSPPFEINVPDAPAKPAEGPCHCSATEKIMVTLVITLVFFFALSYLLVYA